MQYSEPRITDNREEWAKKVLAQSVPEHELDTALNICIGNATERVGFGYNYLSQLKPRLIAENWNKPMQYDKT